MKELLFRAKAINREKGEQRKNMFVELLRKEDEGGMKYYWFTFSDGYSVCVKGFSKQELRVEENKHGRLLRKVEA